MAKQKVVQQPDLVDPKVQATAEGDRFSCRWEGAVVLRCRGELDMDSRLALRCALDQVPQSIAVVVDLSDVGFLDCGAVGVFERARNARRAEGGDLHVREPSAHTRRVLSIVGLNDLVLRVGDLRVEVDVTDEVQRPPATDVSTVVDAWAARVGDLPDQQGLVFRDPVRLVSSLLGTDDRPQQSQPPPLTPGSVPRSDDSTVSSAVLQLLVLDDLLRLPATDADALAKQRTALITTLIGGLLAELEALTLIDPLTGLLNRRALDRNLPAAVAAARRHRHGLVVVMVDVDGLKSINDGLGHPVGDGALRGVAESLRDGCRPEDGAYRIGGDEFVLVLHGIGAGDVNGVMDRLRRPAPFTWGCAEMGAEGHAIAEADADADADADAELAARLLELADDRMRRRRVEIRDPAGHLLRASRDSIVVEQARGFIAERLDVDLDASMDKLQSMARQRDEPVASTAARLVDGTLELTTADPARAPVAEHAPAAVDRVSGSTSDRG